MNRVQVAGAFSDQENRVEDAHFPAASGSSACELAVADPEDQHAETWQQRYMRRYYTARPDWLDGTAEYWKFIARHVRSGAKILELGPGPANRSTGFLAEHFGHVDGLDIDPDAKSNKHLCRCFIYDGGRWPCDDESYDAVISDMVLEHVEEPNLLVAEARRILRRGGTFIFRAPNLWHYVTLASRCTPHRFHRLVANRLRNLPEGAHDPYPTFYRMNTRRSLGRLFSRHGMTQAELSFIEKQPSYGMSSRLMFLAFMGYERLVNSTCLLQGCRSTILGAYQRQD